MPPRRRPVPVCLATATVIGLALSGLGGLPAVAAPPTFAAAAPVGAVPAGATTDEFEAATLGPQWSILNESGANWSLTSNPGNLTVKSQPGDTYQGDNSAKNVFLVDVPAGDFTAVTTFRGLVTQDFQGAGLIAMKDLDSYVRAGLSHVSFAPGGPTVIENGLETDAAYSSTFTPRAGSTGETLKLQRVGNVVTTSYLADGIWVQAAQVTVSFDTTKVGLYALAAGAGASHEVVFDHFSLTAAEGRSVVPQGTFTLRGTAAGTYLTGGAAGSALALVPDRPAGVLAVTVTPLADSAFSLRTSGNDLPIVLVGGSVRVGAAGEAPAALRLTDAGGGRLYLRTADSTGDAGYVGVGTGGALVVGGKAAAVTVNTETIAGAGTLAVDGDGKTVDISKDLYGLFYEDINYAADGGLYAELVRNRSFEFNSADNGSFNGLTGWQTVDAPAAGTPTTTVVSDAAMMNKNNRFYLDLDATAAGDGVRNLSYNSGIAVESGKSYDASLWARSAVAQTLTVRVADAAGTVYATGTVAVDGSDTWKKYGVTVTATGTTAAGRYAVLAGAPGRIKLDMVSLMPQDTWVGPVNGKTALRKDLAQAVDDLNPSFLRFPGGCVTNVGTFSGYEESGFTERKRTYQWKETLGPVEERPTNWNFWGYNQSYGIGYLEYFELAEDMGATPLPVLSVGANGCGGAGLAEMKNDDPRFQRWVDDTVDLIEFANGDAGTEWGAKRIALGHPEPFGMRYIGLGNEENTDTFQANFAAFRDAVKAKYPDILIVSNSGPDSSGARFDQLWEFNRAQKVDLVDEHYYRDPSWFLSNTHRYDSYDRNGPKVFLGEYASRGNTLYNALSEAAYMTALERNSDVVKMASYAPVYANEDYIQWNPDMIWFDNDERWLTPNYHVQHMFMNNVGDEVVPSTYGGGANTAAPLDGGIFLSTWNTAATYDNVKVTSGADGATLFADDFATAAQWLPQRGTWAATGGRYVQSATDVTDARSIITGAYTKDWNDYTVEVDATKTAGAEGFLVGFAAGGADDYYWWNLGGWNNTRSVLQKADGGGATEVKALENRTLTTGQTYKVKIEVKDRTIDLYLDGVLQMTYTEPAAEKFFQVATRDTTTGDLLVKVVNTTTATQRTSVQVADVALQGTATVTELTDDPAAQNTKAAKNTVTPTTRTLSGLGGTFAYDFPASSVTFLRLPVAADAPVPTSTAPVAVSTASGVAPVLPATVAATYTDGATRQVGVTWAAVDPASYAKPGTFPVSGVVAGSATVTATATVTVLDGTAPVLTVTVAPAAPDGAGGWWRSAVDVTATATDDSGAAPVVQLSEDGGTTWDTATARRITDGTRTLWFRAVDAAGIISTVVEKTVKVDGVAPTATAAVDTAARTVTVDAADAASGSGVQRLEYRVDGGAWTTADGARAVVTVGAAAATVEYRPVDVAGNVGSTGSASVPATGGGTGTATVTLTSGDEPTDDGWYTSDVLVTMTAPAGTIAQYRLDGGTWRTYTRGVTVSANGSHVLDHRLVRSNLVVANSAGSVPVKVDKAVPTATVVRVPTTGNGTPRNPVTLSFGAADTLSGVDRIEYMVNRSSWTPIDAGRTLTFGTVGDHLVSYRSYDVAGNASVLRTVTVRITADVATTVKASVTTVARGGFVTFSLAGFDRFDTVALSAAGLTLGSVFTDHNGAARVTVKVPAAMPVGAATVTARGSDGDPSATVKVTVR